MRRLVLTRDHIWKCILLSKGILILTYFTHRHLPRASFLDSKVLRFVYAVHTQSVASNSYRIGNQISERERG